MTEQKRIDALAETLHFALYERQICDCTKEDCECIAIAILAALPPDWCGHHSQIKQAATIARLREALESIAHGAEYADLRWVVRDARAALAQPEGDR